MRITRLLCIVCALVVAAGCSRSGSRVDDGGPEVAARSADPGASASAADPTATSARVVTMEVGGMVCAACEQKVAAQLKQVPGVIAVRVNLAERNARVTCAPGVADTALIGAVRRAGPEYLGLIVSR